MRLQQCVRFARYARSLSIMCVYVCMYMYLCMYVCVYVFTCVYVYMYVCMYVCVCTYACMYVCMCVCRWLLLHGKEKKALDVLKYIYQTQDKAESYYNKIKCSSNVMSFREQVKLTLQWKVLQRSNIVAYQI